MSALTNVDEIPDPVAGIPVPQYEPGEIVDVRIEGFRVTHQAGSRLQGYAPDDPRQRVHVLALGPGVEVHRRVPAAGMPEPGDVWRDRFGGLWYAVTDTAASDKVLLIDPTASYNHRSVVSVLASAGPLVRLASAAGLRETPVARIIAQAQADAIEEAQT